MQKISGIIKKSKNLRKHGKKNSFGIELLEVF